MFTRMKLSVLLIVRLSPLLAGSAIITGVLALGLLPGSGAPSAPRATAGVDCVQVAAEFTDYPLVFPGPEFQGLPLTGCQRSKKPETRAPDGTLISPASDSFGFVYGTCTPGPDAGCPPPVQVIVDPPCGPMLSDAVKTEKVTIRGTQVDVKTDGSLRIESGDFKASVFALAGGYEANKATAMQVVEQLRGANDSGAALTARAALDTGLQAAAVC